MKYILIITVFYCCGANAQKDSLSATASKNKARYEMGMNLYASRIRGGDYYSQYKSIADHYACSGVYFKYYRGNNVWRSAFDFFQKIVNANKNGYYNTGSHIVSSKSLQLSVGYQRMLGYKKIAPYIFVDAACNYSRELRSSPLPDYIGYFLSSYHYSDYNLVSENSLALSLAPGLGLRINLGKTIRLSFESSAQFFYMFETNNYNPSEKNKAVGINARPLQCSIGFSF